MPKRTAISKKTRFDIFKRDSFTCQYCGNKPPSVILEVDHINPVSNGGNNSQLNLITSCFDCNRGKSKNLLSNIPESISDIHKKQMESFEQLKELNKFLKRKRKQDDKIINELTEFWFSNFNGGNNLFELLGKKRFPSIRNFLKHLTEIEIKDAMELSLCQCNRNDESSLWKYFCGICWNWIKNPSWKGE